MEPTVRQLLDQPGLALKLLSGGRSGAIDTPISWVYSSDLVDPTPFLDAGQLVLTTGTQFAPETAPDALFPEYVARLQHHGVSAIGFGTEVIRATPPELLRACRELGMPLFEVPYRVPFIAVIRFVADLIAEASHVRDSWALNAQRAISFAALRPNAVHSILSELSRQLGREVSLYDARSRPPARFDENRTRLAIDESLRQRIDAEAERLIGRGQRSSSTITDGDMHITLQTLGRRGTLRGALVTAGHGALDAADQTVVTSVVALTGLALEQNRELGRARGQLRSGLLQALIEGSVPLVRRIRAQLGTALPAEPVRFVVLDASRGQREPIFAELEAGRADDSSRLFFAAHDGRIVLCCAADEAEPIARRLAERHHVDAGISTPLDLGATAIGIEQATRAIGARRPAATSAGQVSVFSDIVGSGLSSLLDGADARAIAHAILAPIDRSDEEHGTRLLASARVWLEHNGAWDPAARELGIHRHTLKARIAQIERLGGISLESFGARTNLWLALEQEERGRAQRR